METNVELSICRWDTPLSDLNELYFVSLRDEDRALCLTLEDRSGERYEVIFERPGPYRMSGEQYLVHYWAASEQGRGWTFRVDGAEWVRDLKLRDVYLPQAQHFVIATLEDCLEVLSEREPIIRKP